MPQQSSPAWVSTAIAGLLGGPWRDGTVMAAMPAASYVRIRAGDGPASPGPGGQHPEYADKDGKDAVMMALLSPAAIRLPLGACIPGDLPGPGTAVRVGHGLIVAGEGCWHPARWWDPRPRLDAAALLRSGPELLSLVREEPGSSFGLPLPDALQIATALAAGDPGPALAAIGLGPGLTPAADDVVAGALAVLALSGRLRDPLRVAISAGAAGRTTMLSAALIAAAAAGQVIPQAARVLRTISAEGPPGRLRPAAAGLLGVGSTSGHDLCAGMAGALAGAS